MTRRDDRAYREYVREEQRSQRGGIAGRMQLDFHHGLPGLKRHDVQRRNQPQNTQIKHLFCELSALCVDRRGVGG